MSLDSWHVTSACMRIYNYVVYNYIVYVSCTQSCTSVLKSIKTCFYIIPKSYQNYIKYIFLW